MKRRYANHRERVRWWREKTKGLQWFAVASTALKPEKVDIEKCGHHVSIGFEPGLRSYAFASQSYRDTFVKLYRSFGARECGEPSNG